MKRREFITGLVGAAAVAPGGAGAATGDAGDRTFSHSHAKLTQPSRRFSPRSRGSWLRRRSERTDRHIDGRRAIRSVANTCNGIGATIRYPRSLYWRAPMAALAAKAASSQQSRLSLCSGADPVEAWPRSSLNRPGGNLTGINLFLAEVVAKRLEFLGEMASATKPIVISAIPLIPCLRRVKREQWRAPRARLVCASFSSMQVNPPR